MMHRNLTLMLLIASTLVLMLLSPITVHFVASGDTCSDGDLRLQGGRSLVPEFGVLEICFFNEWGGVCHDLFDRRDAQVACRQLGFPTDSAGSYTTTTLSSTRIWLSRLECVGNEQRLEDCTSLRSPSICSLNEIIIVRCRDEISLSLSRSFDPRSDIACPDSLRTYMCVTRSYNFSLTFRVSVPGEVPFIISFNNSNTAGISNRRWNYFLVTAIVSRLSNNGARGTITLRYDFVLFPNQTVSIECLSTHEVLQRSFSISTTLPAPPINLLHLVTQHDVEQSTVQFIYQLQYGGVGEPREGDDPLISIMPPPISLSGNTSILAHNVVYQVNVSSTNCYGPSRPAMLNGVQIVGCGAVRISNGSVNHDHTAFGAMVIYQCNAGFRPSAPQQSVCLPTTEWVPAILNDCILVITSVNIHRVTTRVIDCPGDTILYLCSIESNSEAINLTWTVTIPGQQPLSITYSSNVKSTDVLSNFVTTSLTGFVEDQYINSTLELLIDHVPIEQIKIECSIGNLGNSSTIVQYRYSVPRPPTDLNVIADYPGVVLTTVTLNWNPPQGKGPEAIVDNYTIFIGLSAERITVQSPPWNVTLLYNIIYSISLIASNCAGESVPVVLSIMFAMKVVALRSPQNITVVEGSSAMFECRFSATPELPIWSINGSTYNADQLPDRHRFRFGILTVSNVSVSDNGVRYACSVHDADSGIGYLTVIRGTVEIIPLTRNVSREDISCPGDIISYNCSIQSNIIHLIWHVTYSEEESIGITYYDDDNSNRSVLDRYITTSVTGFRSNEFIYSKLEVAVQLGIPDEIAIQCSIGNLINDTTSISINISVPFLPTGFSITREYHDHMETTVTLDWNSPQGRGPEAVVDNYTISISPTPPGIQAVVVILSSPWNVTLQHNNVYVVNLASVNCAGASSKSSTLIIEFVNCGDPMSPSHGSVGNYSHTREGAIATYQCDDGFRPSAPMITTCMSTMEWIPQPQLHTCTLITATVDLIRLNRRSDIECPGDTIKYNCLIQSNSEAIHLTWRVLLPGLAPLNITYYNGNMNLSNLNDYITTLLVEYRNDVLVNSTLELIIQPHMSTGAIVLECIISQLANSTAIVHINNSVPLLPTGFNVTEVYHGSLETTVTLNWDSPQGTGPEAIVDNYTTFISPPPPGMQAVVVILSSPWNVTLQNNIAYVVNLTSVNCAGVSSNVSTLSIKFVNCGDPISPTHGSVGNYTHTREGAAATYQCDDGFRPSAPMITTCMSTMEWIPQPQLHVCTLVAATVHLIPLDRTVSKNDIECPGDTIRYNCLILSNSESIHLTWRVLLPGLAPLNTTYHNANMNFSTLNDYITTFLVEYRDGVLVNSTLELIVQPRMPAGAIELECIINQLANSTIIVYFNNSVPLPPTGFNVIREYHDMEAVVTLDWDSPQGTGPQAIVDNYTIFITPAPPGIQTVVVAMSSPWNVTLQYNIVYVVNISSVNCAGASSNFSTLIIEFVNCGDPMSPTHGSVGNYAHTREGATATYRCDDGFRPSAPMITTCMSTMEWIPQPQLHACTLITATVDLIRLNRRSDIECPGDTIKYNCLIQSNSEAIHLTWRVLLPGLAPLNITYYNGNMNLSNLNDYITSLLVEYRNDVLVNSTLELTIQLHMSTDAIVLECLINQLANSTTVVHINNSVPLLPTGFNVIEVYHGSLETTVTLNWDAPQGTGPEAIVDNYTIFISPTPPDMQGVVVILSSPWNITLQNNIVYEVNLTSVNCAGVSSNASTLSIKFVNCGDPMSPTHGSVGNYTHTREGATATYQCDDGFRPSAPMITTCMSTMEWIPQPQLLTCTLITATVHLITFDRRNNIECPGDTIRYNCLILSNSESIHLTWRVLLPGLAPLNTTYHNANMNFFTLNDYITTFLIEYRDDVLVNSTLELIVQPHMPADAIVLECIINQLANSTIIVHVNTSVPLPPTNLRIFEEYHSGMETTVTLNWDLPQSTGPEAIVDNYTIFISPGMQAETVVLSSPWNVTLQHNIVYEVNLTSVNCAGVSNRTSTLSIEIVNCGDPMSPTHGSVGNYTHTREGATATYQCDAGFRPSAPMITTCMSTMEWIPQPQLHACMLITAIVNLDRILSRNDIECPGDTITYNCVILSNSEAIHLTWRVLLPGLTPLNITYHNANINMFILNDYITTLLVEYRNDVLVNSTLELIIQPRIPTNSIMLECLINHLANSTITVHINTSVPRPPTGFNIMREYHGHMETTVTLAWDSPQGTGPEAVVDNYTIFISPPPPGMQAETVVLSSPWNVTLQHNIVYEVNLTSVNCAGVSDRISTLSTEFVNCGDPMSPTHGSVGNYAHTREGATATYQCNDGFRPSAPMITTCMTTMEWIPQPQLHVCMLITAIVDLIPLERTRSRNDIECPGDTIRYNCVILSNSEAIHLTWRVLLPGFSPLNITYHNANLNMFILNDYITTFLVEYQNDMLVNSTLELIIQPHMPVDAIVLECIINHLANSTITVHINTSVPLLPTDFNVIREYHGHVETTVTLNWEPPHGTGPEAVVNNYTIFISPTPPSMQAVEVVVSSPWNVTLEHNIPYVVNLTSVNCAGVSSNFSTLSIKFVNCGDPMSPTHGSVGNYTHTREGATATYQCDDGFRPSAPMITTCTSTMEWIPQPQLHSCVFITAIVNLIPFDRTVSRNDIECPGDTIRYNCLILSNSEAIHLTWRVLIPGLAPLNVTYNNGNMNLSSLNDYINTFLVEYRNDVLVNSTLELIIQPHMPTNAIVLECIINSLANSTLIVHVNTSVPLPPTGFNIIREYHGPMETTDTLNWDPPHGAGPEAIVDNYTIFISPTPPGMRSVVVVVSSPWNVTLEHNIPYIVNLTSVNCAGVSNNFSKLNIIFVNCGDPMSPTHGSVGNYAHTREGATATYQCDAGFRPSAPMITTCMSTMEWIPQPQLHICILIFAFVNLSLLERRVSRNDIECPGDIIIYNCLIQSNSETIRLTWHVLLPGQEPLRVTYHNANLNLTNPADYITTYLVEYRNDVLVNSTLELIVQPNMPTEAVVLKCSFEDVASNTTVYVKKSVPRTPSNLNITREYHGDTETTVTLDWVPPQGIGPETVVDNYTFFISPAPSSSQKRRTIHSRPWNVTLEHNIIYFINLTASNCAGESVPFSLSDILFVNCGNPMPPIDGSVGHYIHTRQGATAIYQCDDGFRPSAPMFSVCMSTANWVPAPQQHICTLIVATVEIIPLPRIVSPGNIECPGDIISYNCSLKSNSEAIHLAWHVAYSEEESISIAYYNTTITSNRNSRRYVSTSLTGFRSDEFIHSTLDIVVELGIPDVITIQCSIRDLGSDSTGIRINISAPLSPSNLSITREHHQDTETTVTLDWDPPRGIGPQAFVDNYTIFISPLPPNRQGRKTILLRQFNVTLEHNVLYSIDVTASNCAGESMPFSLPAILFVNCGNPMHPIHGSVRNYIHTREGATATYQCNSGFSPSRRMLSTCTSTADWVPAPQRHVCTLVVDIVENVEVEMMNDTSVIVSWERNTALGLVNYTVYYRPTAKALGERSERAVIVPSSNLSAVIKNLMAGIEYQFQVAAVAVLERKVFFGERSLPTLITVALSIRLTTPTLSTMNLTLALTSDESSILFVGVITASVIALTVVSISLLMVILYKRHKNLYAEGFVEKKLDKGPPEILEFPANDIHAVEGECVYFSVVILGNPRPLFTWFYKDTELVPGTNIDIELDGSLCISPAELNHSGVYKLCASNKRGSAERKVKLIVIQDVDEFSITDDDQEVANTPQPIPVDEFEDYVAMNHANSDKLFKLQFNGLDTGDEHSKTIGTLPRNKKFNHFEDETVYDHNRIVLESMEGLAESFINACYIQGFSVPDRFIVSLGPKKHMIIDFWRLVWQERPLTIVMLANLQVGNKSRCERYWPEYGSDTFGPFTVILTGQQILCDYCIRNMTVICKSQPGHRRLKLTQYQYTAWPDTGVPDHPTSMLSFVRKVTTEHKTRKKPILVHCGAGVGCTGVFICLDSVLDKVKRKQVVDIARIINKIRHQRMKMVQTLEEYIFIHDAILESLICGDTQVKVSDLKTILRKSNVLQNQFEVLQRVSIKPNEAMCKTAMENCDMNRSLLYLPSDKHRVILSGESPDYIHAVSVNSYRQKAAYIIAEDPMKITARNMWKVIYDKLCDSMVMLSVPEENEECSCWHYWPDTGSVAHFGEFALFLASEEMREGYTIRMLILNNENSGKSHQVTQFHITCWNSDGLCHNLRSVVEVIEELENFHRKISVRPVFVHCSNTVTRSGMFCAMAMAIERYKIEHVVDIFQAVQMLRVYKPEAVPKIEDYKTVHDAMLLHIKAGSAKTTPRTSPKSSPKSFPATTPQASPKTSPKCSPKHSPKTSPRSSPITSPRASPRTSMLKL